MRYLSCGTSHVSQSHVSHTHMCVLLHERCKEPAVCKQGCLGPTRVPRCVHQECRSCTEESGSQLSVAGQPEKRILHNRRPLYLSPAQ